jgi:hypothetical protein
LVIFTPCCVSLTIRPASFVELPIMNSPGGIQTKSIVTPLPTPTRFVPSGLTRLASYSQTPTATASSNPMMPAANLQYGLVKCFIASQLAGQT